MEDRAKERLTGAAILVALVVVVVPELLRGERDAPPPAPVARDGAPPQRSFTIELGSAPRIAADSPAVTPDPQPAPIAPATAPATPPPTVTPLVTTPAAAVAATVTPSPPANPGHASAANGWVVQLGTFSRRENATRLAQRAAAKGLHLSVSGPDARGLFRVRSAVQADRAAALVLQARLKSAGFGAVVSAAQ